MKGINLKSWTVLTGLICGSFFFSACAGLDSRVQKDPFDLKTAGISQYPLQDAQALFDKIRNNNKEIKTIKGIGTLRVVNKKDRFTSRLAWIGCDDGKMRIEIMGPYGQSVASLAATEHTLYFYSHVEKKFYKKDLTDNALKTYLDLPITVAQLVDFLSGRIPIDFYDQIALTDNTVSGGVVLHIFKKAEKRVIKLFMDKEKESINKAEFYQSPNTLSFRTEFSNRKMIGAYKIPFQISIVDGKGSDFNLEMERIWANADIDDSIFKLTRPQ